MAYFRRSRPYPGLFLREESTIALASDFGKDRGRSMRGVGDKSEPLLSCRPADRRGVFNEITDKVILRVANPVSLLHSMPADAEGDVRRYMATFLQGIGKGQAARSRRGMLLKKQLRIYHRVKLNQFTLYCQVRC
jgi:hypothetical protein